MSEELDIAMKTARDGRAQVERLGITPRGYEEKDRYIMLDEIDSLRAALAEKEKEVDAQKDRAIKYAAQAAQMEGVCEDRERWKSRAESAERDRNEIRLQLSVAGTVIGDLFYERQEAREYGGRVLERAHAAEREAKGLRERVKELESAWPNEIQARELVAAKDQEIKALREEVDWNSRGRIGLQDASAHLADMIAAQSRLLAEQTAVIEGVREALENWARKNCEICAECPAPEPFEAAGMKGLLHLRWEGPARTCKAEWAWTLIASLPAPKPDSGTVKS